MNVNTPVKAVIYGRDHESPGEIYVHALDALGAALGTSPGTTAKPNEDAAGIVARGRDMVLAIADGHWGREASEIAIARSMELHNPDASVSVESQIRERLFSLFEQVNDRLYELGSSNPGSLSPETTLIVCHVRDTGSGKYLYWSSFGDSFLFLLRGRELKQLNTLQPRWLGYISRMSDRAETRVVMARLLGGETRCVGVAAGLETGEQELETGDIILLCSDGLTGSDRAPDASVLTGLTDVLVSELPPGTRVQQLITSALARGEKDNVSCLAVLIP